MEGQHSFWESAKKPMLVSRNEMGVYHTHHKVLPPQPLKPTAMISSLMGSKRKYSLADPPTMSLKQQT
jgi:hypothetical protein